MAKDPFKRAVVKEVEQSTEQQKTTTEPVQPKSNKKVVAKKPTKEVTKQVSKPEPEEVLRGDYTLDDALEYIEMAKQACRSVSARKLLTLARDEVTEVIESLTPEEAKEKLETLLIESVERKLLGAKQAERDERSKSK